MFMMIKHRECIKCFGAFPLAQIASMCNEEFAENGINDKVCMCIDWVPYFCYIAYSRSGVCVLILCALTVCCLRTCIDLCL